MTTRHIFAAILAALAICPATADEQPPEPVPYRMELPAELRAQYRNPDGSCVQCSIGLCGLWQAQPAAAALLFDTDYGPRVRGGSGPSRVEAYTDARKIPCWNVTGPNTWDWMKWAARTRRFAAIGAGRIHFQTLYGWDPSKNLWYVCNNNSTHKVDAYTWEQFRQLHLASGQWVVILDQPPPAPIPRYVTWWH